MQCLLLTVRRATMRHGGIKWCHLFNGVGEFLGRTLKVFVEPVVRFAPGVGQALAKQLTEMFAHQWVGVQNVETLCHVVGQQLDPAQLRQRLSPFHFAQTLQGVGQARNDGCGAQDPDGIRRCRPVK